MDEPQKPLRGLYSRVNISVSALNRIIIVLCIALVAAMAFGIANRGFQVSFDTRGGTAVESQKRMYGELVEPLAEPTREGYVFDGWYLDPGTTVPWNLEEDSVTESMILYARWREP